ncbi:MAG TPA: glycosyltransferase [Phycisphaerae bacterium]|nr:glycosyltransferase [Phycisphaerae bacterium]
MRVLYVIPSMRRGGAETLLAAQVPHFIAQGVEPIIVTISDQDALIRETQLPVRHVSLGLTSATSTIGGFWLSIAIARRLRRVIREFRPDLVHLNLYKSDAWGRLAARGLSDTVTTWHSTDRWMSQRSISNVFRRWLERRTLKRSSAHVIAVSEAVRTWSCQHLRVPSDRARTIYNGVDLSRFIDAIPSRHNRPLRIVMVGRFYREKGQDIALEALRLVRDAVVPFTADLLGEGPLLEDMKRLAKQLDLGDSVRFCGVCRDVPAALPSYDLFLMPSRFEGLGMAALEAMASYVPAVASRVSGLQEVFDHEENGLLVPPEDPQALAEAIIRMLQDEPLRRRLALAARRKVERCFDLKRQVQKIMAYYRQICGKDGGAMDDEP